MKSQDLYKFILTLIICCFCNSIFCQSQKIDSLKFELSQSSSIDSNRIELLMKTANAYWTIDNDSMTAYYYQVLEEAPKVSYLSKEINSLSNLGYYYFSTKNDYKKALMLFEKGLALSIAHQDSVGIAQLYNDLGWYHWKKGDHLQALEYYIKIPDYHTGSGSSRILWMAYLNLGVIQAEMGSQEKAIEYYNLALEATNKESPPRQIGLVWNNLGVTYQKDTSKLALAMQYFMKADSIFTQLGNIRMLTLVNYNKGKNYLLEDLPSQALPFFKTALKHNELIGDIERDVMIHLERARAYQKMDQIRTSIAIGKNALEMLNTIDIQTYHLDFYKLLADNYDLIGNYFEASKMHQRYISFYNENEVDKKASKIAELHSLYTNEKHEKKVLELENKELETAQALSNSKYLLQCLGFGFAILLLSAIIFFYYNRSRELQQINSLKSNLSKDLHDNIGASLNHIKMLSNQIERASISGIEKNNKLLKIKTISNEVMNSMYDMIWTLKKDNETIGGLIEKIQDYTDSTLGDFGIPYQFKIEEVDETIELTLKQKVNAYNIFKESINNILKHTISNHVLISFTKNNTIHFKMIIVNTFDIKKESGDISFNKNGIVNMKKRAEHIKGNLKVDETPNQFTVEFEF